MPEPTTYILFSGLTARLAELQTEVNCEMSALTPKQRAERAKDHLRCMPGQAYLFRGTEDTDA
jgi:hypothetical protein